MQLTRRDIKGTPLDFLGIYPDCNFTNGFEGWTNNGSRRWIIVNSTMKDVGLLTGRQGMHSFSSTLSILLFIC